MVLREHEDVIVIYPIHLNPEVTLSAEDCFGKQVFSHMEKHRLLKTNTHLNRFLIVAALENAELLSLIRESYFILTDSGGIQEEAITLGKPVLVLRDTTERPEGVFAGASKLVGSDTVVITNASRQLLADRTTYDQMSNSQQLFGDGHASRRIVNILESSVGTSQDLLIEDNTPPHTSAKYSPRFDLVVVITVWKRDTTEKTLHLIKKQTALVGARTAVIVFQNGNHVNITGTLENWKDPSSWHGNEVRIIHVASKLETGYYGRFLSPLAVDTNQDANFIVLDDDIIFGKRYFENMLRVVQNGYLATRNGRFVNEESNKFDWHSDWREGFVDTFNFDDEYDFGGHIWAGRIAWLRAAWLKPPILLETSEDFWLSAVLKNQLGTHTRRPRCPEPESGGDLELCACSMRSAHKHAPARVGNTSVTEVHSNGTNMRTEAIRTIRKEYNFSSIISREPDAPRTMGSRHKELPIAKFRPTAETLSVFSDCLYWY